MNVNSFTIMEALSDRMRWLQGNQQVVSENISHSDTPGFTPQELAAQDFSSLVGKMSRTSSSGSHSFNIKRPTAPTVGFNNANTNFKRVDTTIYERRPDGNGVALEEETMKLASNQMEFALVSGLYKKNSRLMKLALGKTA